MQRKIAFKIFKFNTKYGKTLMPKHLLLRIGQYLLKVLCAVRTHCWVWQIKCFSCRKPEDFSFQLTQALFYTSMLYKKPVYDSAYSYHTACSFLRVSNVSFFLSYAQTQATLSSPH